MDTAANHLIEMRKKVLISKTNQVVSNKQINLQDAVFNNFLFVGKFNSVINGKTQLSESFDPETIWQNYNLSTFHQDLNRSQWYYDPPTKKYSSLSNASFAQIKQSSSLFYTWKSILKDSLDSRSGLYNSIYYIYESDRMFVQYPAHPTEIFFNWKLRDPCPYFDSGVMDFYDGRCRPFYKKAVENKYDSTFYGPYNNPSENNKFYALTLSQAIKVGNDLHGVMNHDFNLNFKDEIDKFLNINDTNSRYFITTFEGQLLTHSKIEIQKATDSLTKAEFSKTWLPLEEELYNKETEEFNSTILPLIKSVSETTLTEYMRFGEAYIVAVKPISVRYFDNTRPKQNKTKIFVFSLAINKDFLISSITDKTEFIAKIIIWMWIFTGVFIALSLFAIYMLVKISTRALRPIKILNFKVSTLVKTNGMLNLENTKKSMTSQEALNMYEVFWELITAKKFTSNTIFQNNDAVAIMDYAEAYTVFSDNKKAQGIWMTNIGHIYFRHKDYQKAAKSYEEAAQCAYKLHMRYDGLEETKKEHIRLYWKRIYYKNIWLFLKVTKNREMSDPKLQETELQEVMKELEFTKKLFETYMVSVNDLLIMLYLHTSYWFMKTRRLISAERDLSVAKSIFDQTDEIRKADRLDIPIIPKWILFQRMLLQKGLIQKMYNKHKEAVFILTNLFKIGKIYDPMARKDALDALMDIFRKYPKQDLSKLYPDVK
jgi:hypothetical protein